MNNFIAHNDEIRKEMLESIKYSSLDDLYKQIPVRFNNFKLSDPLSEMETQKESKL